MNWQDKINLLAEKYCKDINDRKLLEVETYDPSFGLYDDDKRMCPQGIYGDWIRFDDYKNLAERFLLAMELIDLLEQNSKDI